MILQEVPSILEMQVPLKRINMNKDYRTNKNQGVERKVMPTEIIQERDHMAGKAHILRFNKTYE
jgi:hypothetical protein